MDYKEVYDGLNEMFTDYFIDVGASKKDLEIRDKALEAVQIQIPQKPVVMKSIFTGKTMDECPRCRTTVHIFGRCPCCGQAIDWSEYVF